MNGPSAMRPASTPRRPADTTNDLLESVVEQTGRNAETLSRFLAVA